MLLVLPAIHIIVFDRPMVHTKDAGSVPVVLPKVLRGLAVCDGIVVICEEIDRDL